MATVNVFYVDNMRDGYPEVARAVVDLGTSSAPRGRDTRELIGATLVLRDPTDALPVGIDRRVNPRIAAVEALQLLAGQAAPELVLKASPSFHQYREENGNFWGNYGDRIGVQFAAAYERLRDDPETRQAVITLWRPEYDLMVDGKRDYPCTVGFQFLIRDGELVMITNMRSNDVWLGLTYDVFQFTQLQLALAACLDVPPGAYVHRPGSLHVYEEDIVMIRQLQSVPDRGPVEEVCTALAQPGTRGLDFVLAARKLLRGGPWDGEPLNHGAASWYEETLRSLR